MVLGHFDLQKILLLPDISFCQQGFSPPLISSVMRPLDAGRSSPGVAIVSDSSIC